MAKLKKPELKAFKEQLLALRARLRGDVNAMAETALKRNRADAGESSTMPIHMADLGSDNFEQEFTLTLMEAEGGTLEAVETALERLEEGLFGTCEQCDGPINKNRLNAIPYASLCIKCAQANEDS